MVSINSLIAISNQYFLDPAGLYALTALIPLIVFYLVKKKPEEELMPSMMFFMEDKKSSRVRKAFRNLQRNNLLILHILIISLLAAAVAQPYVQTKDVPEETVVILDSSASMYNQINHAKDFAEDNLGDKNTLIVADSNPEVVLEEASDRQVRNYVEEIEPTHSPGNVADGLSLASHYSGHIIVASDLQSSEGQRDPVDVLKDLKDEGRSVNVFDPEPDNSWGIINIQNEKDESYVDVKNFEESEAEIEVKKNGDLQNYILESGEVKTITFSTDPGKNKIELMDNGFKPDNTGYVSVPKEETFEVAFISERDNPYFETALDLIDFVDVKRYNPPIEDENYLEADVFVFGETDRVLSDTIEEVEGKVEEGSSAVVFGHENVFDQGFNILPVEESSERVNTSVEIFKPQTTNIQSEIFKTDKTEGDSHAEPEEALVMSSHGEGNILFYNIDDKNFRNEITYPLFWQEILRDLVNSPSIDELNIQTGEELDYPSIERPDGEKVEGTTEIDEKGFYKTESGIYAANLENIDESVSQPRSIEDSGLSEEKADKELQSYLISIVLMLLVLEALYLRYIGDL